MFRSGCKFYLLLQCSYLICVTLQIHKMSKYTENIGIFLFDGYLTTSIELERFLIASTIVQPSIAELSYPQKVQG